MSLTSQYVGDTELLLYPAFPTTYKLSCLAFFLKLMKQVSICKNEKKNKGHKLAQASLSFLLAVLIDNACNSISELLCYNVLSTLTKKGLSKGIWEVNFLYASFYLGIRKSEQLEGKCLFSFFSHCTMGNIPLNFWVPVLI